MPQCEKQARQQDRIPRFSRKPDQHAKHEAPEPDFLVGIRNEIAHHVSGIQGILQIPPPCSEDDRNFAHRHQQRNHQCFLNRPSRTPRKQEDLPSTAPKHAESNHSIQQCTNGCPVGQNVVQEKPRLIRADLLVDPGSDSTRSTDEFATGEVQNHDYNRNADKSNLRVSRFATIVQRCGHGPHLTSYLKSLFPTTLSSVVGVRCVVTF